MENLGKNSNKEDSNQGLARITQSHSELVRFENDREVYDFDRCLAFLESRGKELFGSTFRIYFEDHLLLSLLLIYAIGDRQGAVQHGLSLSKGILLTGPIGCGKTSWMKLLQEIVPEHRRYLMCSCRDISFAFNRDGFDVIDQYTNGTGRSHFQTFCFDDLGTEKNIKFFGNECNVLGEILLSRYELLIGKVILTHVTTNCNSSEIENIYGKRVRSRMRRMFNLFSFDKNARDKRR